LCFLPASSLLIVSPLATRYSLSRHTDGIVVRMTDFEDRVRRMVGETIRELGHDAAEIDDVVEPPGADYCVISFTNPEIKPIEVSKPLGAGESQELDEIRRALQYRFKS
jgi:hypothetical protein